MEVSNTKFVPKYWQLQICYTPNLSVYLYLLHFYFTLRTFCITFDFILLMQNKETLKKQAQNTIK